MPGNAEAVETQIFFSGAGLAKAIEPALREARALWEAAFREGCKPYIEIEPQTMQWRLTEYGVMAQEDLKGNPEQQRYLIDTLRTPGLPGAERLPVPFVPGVLRPVAAGDGQAERVEVVKLPSEAIRVSVENLGEVSEPLRAIVKAVEKLLMERPKPLPKDQSEFPTGKEYSPPMSKSRMMQILGMHSRKVFKSFAEKQGLIPGGNRQLWRICLDGMDDATARKLRSS